MDVSAANVAAVRQVTTEVAKAAEGQRIAARHRALDADEQRAEARIEALVLKVVEKVRARFPWPRNELIRAFRDRDGADTAITRAAERGLIVIKPASTQGESVWPAGDLQ